jgi:hypothetical protein
VIAISPRCAQEGYPHEDIHLVLRGYDKQAVQLLDIQRVWAPVDIAQLRRDAQAARPLFDSAFDHDSIRGVPRPRKGELTVRLERRSETQG